MTCHQRDMKKLLLLLPLLLAGCVGLDPCTNTDYKVLSKIPLPAGTSGTKFLVIPFGSTDKDIIAFASSSCSRRWCKLLIWDNEPFAGRKFPLTGQQASSQIAEYTHNPSKLYESLVIRGRETPWVPARTCTRGAKPNLGGQ